MYTGIPIMRVITPAKINAPSVVVREKRSMRAPAVSAIPMRIEYGYEYPKKKNMNSHGDIAPNGCIKNSGASVGKKP